jgi:hypothetical protein
MEEKTQFRIHAPGEAVLYPCIYKPETYRYGSPRNCRQRYGLWIAEDRADIAGIGYDPGLFDGLIRPATKYRPQGFSLMTGRRPEVYALHKSTAELAARLEELTARNRDWDSIFKDAFEIVAHVEVYEYDKTVLKPHPIFPNEFVEKRMTGKALGLLQIGVEWK